MALDEWEYYQGRHHGRPRGDEDGLPPAFDLQYAADGQLQLRAWHPGTYEWQTASGRSGKVAVSAITSPVVISGPWELSFPPNGGTLGRVTLDQLISWPAHPDKGVRYFSGTATYCKEVEIPAKLLADGQALFLDLGTVKNLAQVKVNDADLGILWKPPFRVNLNGVARAGKNRLEIRVTNLWPNRLIGDEQLPPDVEWKGPQLQSWPQWLLEGQPSPSGRLTFTTWHHWTKDMPLLESGLIGPVKLVSAKVVAARR